MFQSASVSLSGPAFSFLLYETCKGTVKQNGFLLGEIIHKEITSITDNEQRQVDISKIIKVNSVFPCSSNDYFVKGRVDSEKLQKLLGSNFPKVVAWYKYEPTSSVKFTLKDRALHKQFKELFLVPQDLFSVCFLSMECTDNFATYNYTQSFVRYNNGNVDRLSLYIPNLSDPNDTYKNAEPISAVFAEILSSLSIDIENTKGVLAITEIESAIQKYINDTSSKLADAEKALFELEEEIRELKHNKQLKTASEKERIEEDNTADLISFEEPITSEIASNTIEKSPEVTRRSQRTRSRVVINTSPSPDSNKREISISSEIPSSPEVHSKSITPRSKRGKSRKKS